MTASRPAWSKRVHEPITSAELAERAATWAPLADDVRELVEATILSQVEPDVVAEVRSHIAAALDLLRKRTDTGSHGVHVNDDGDVWHWGNAATGLRNAIAPPMSEVSNADGRAVYEATLGAAYEGPPGCVHGGWIALAIDHASGRTAHIHAGGTTFTGTLTVKYLQPTRLGPITTRAWVAATGRNSFTVHSELATTDGVCATGEGIFVLAPWLRSS
ncbi:PaaI family thioesterase [Nocardioides daejeonensis]|uniref:PaaI family thioesterase n=1 Tax=Nocardioides daejeonensis TaxID=1046556 RepID=UPI000D7499D3|nr:PaaI family thioesterase [Nocardioides daejeonensis]